jgi:hypothetical protein
MIFMIVIVALLFLYHSNAKRLEAQLSKERRINKRWEAILDKRYDAIQETLNKTRKAFNLVGNSARWGRIFAIRIANRSQKCGMADGFVGRGKSWANIACAAKGQCVCDGIEKGDPLITTVENLPLASARKDAEEKERRKEFLRGYHAEKRSQEGHRIATAKVVEKITSP